jgi:hypothetical protein
MPLRAFKRRAFLVSLDIGVYQLNQAVDILDSDLEESA